MGAHWRSMPEFFKQHGYVSYGQGKLYHPNKPPNNDEPYSWSQDMPCVIVRSSGDALLGEANARPPRRASAHPLPIAAGARTTSC